MPEMESAIRIMIAILLPQKEGWGEEQSGRHDSPMHHNNQSLKLWMAEMWDMYALEGQTPLA